MRLGAIDAGSNAIRMIIANAADPQNLHRLDSLRIPVRLGHGPFTRGEIDAATIAQAVETFARFRTLFERYQVTRYRAVATSAMRNAQNREVLLHRLYHDTGFDVEIIDGDEEARLVRKAVLKAFAEQEPPRLILDLGGGSLEVSMHIGSAWKSSSLPVGTVRLMETFGLTGAIGRDEAGMVRRYTATLLQTVPPVPAEHLRPAAVCGGNAEAIARLFGDTGSDGMPGFALEQLEQALPEVLDADVEQRMNRFGIRRDRAEVIGVAALVLATVCRGLQVPRLVAPGVGIRDAVLLDLAEELVVEQVEAREAQGKALLTSGRTFANRVGHDLTHGEHVRWLARSIFDQLRDVHGLAPELGVVLELAALLHDVGEVVHPRSHHKHSEYMIRWGRIPGLASPYREMVATLVRTHRKSPPDPKKHLDFGALPKERRQQVRKLAAILRLADGLDTDHQQVIDSVFVSRLGDAITLDLVTKDHRTPLDTASFLRKSDLFESEFRYQLAVTVGPRTTVPGPPMR